MHRVSFSDLKAVAVFFSFLISVNGTVLTTSLSNSQLTVGDKVLFTVSAVPKGATITPPSTDGIMGNITVKNWIMNKAEYEKYDSLAFEYILTTYIPENCTIPELSYIQTHNSVTDTLYTQSIPLTVRSVISGNDSVVEIRELKPPQITGKAPKWWLWVLCSVAGAALITLLIRYLIKGIHKASLPPPPKPAYEEAIEALAVLHGKRLLQQGLIREYVFELSEIFKRYIGRRFEVNASDFTTEEMIGWLGVSGLQKKDRNSVEWFFKTSDPVKFARYTPDESTIERFGKEVVEFLESTRPVPEALNQNTVTDTVTPFTVSSSENKTDAKALSPETTESGVNK